jgi:hypothetical protein
MSEQSARSDHSDEIILPIIALEAGYNGAVINITKDLNLYVRQGGSDVNDGYYNTDQHAFSTGTRAYNEAARYVPSNGAQVIINFAEGTFPPMQAVGSTPGSTPVIVRGKGANLTSIIKNPTTVPGNAAIYADGAYLQVEQLRVGGNALGNGLVSTNGGVITVGAGVDFGAVQPSGGSHMFASSGGKIYNYLPYSISGGAKNHMSVWGAGSSIEGGQSVVTIPSAIAFTGAFADAGAEGYIYNYGTNYTGYANVTGKKFYAYQFGYINTENSGVNYFPGDIAGTYDTGGAYDTLGGANAGPPGVAGPMGPKSLSLQLPVTGDEVGMFFAKAALTITQINVVVRGTTPGVTWSLRYATSRAAVGTPVITADTVTSSTANNTITTFNNPNIPVNNWVWLKVNGTSGVVLEFDMSLQF